LLFDQDDFEPWSSWFLAPVPPAPLPPAQ
jgi:hypothetical protein